MRCLGTLVSVLVLATGSPCWSQDQGDAARDQLVDAVLEVTGTTGQIANVPSLIQAMYGPLEKNISPSKYSKIQGIFRDTFMGGQFLAKQKEYFRLNFNEVFCRQILESYHKESLKRVTEAEVRFSANASAWFTEGKPRGTVSPERYALLQRLVKAGKNVEHGVKIAQVSISGLFTTFNLVISPKKRVQQSVIDGLIESQMAMVQTPEYIAEDVNRYTVEYSGISDSDLLEYIEFEESPEGDYFQAVSFEGFLGAAKSCMNDAAFRIVTELDPNSET